ncbi:MAG: methyltransferase [Verrucomicrobia bacterium]|nr:methyltransferase [Verrucomicrobiota bacterium]MBU1736332.1 methyltransferase [Verrucomicrobiota bacterium]MBU1857365.1 methyltransferase [Verrucomicrobiota bacterium]
MKPDNASHAIAARFSAAASTYHASATIQRAVAERLSAMLAGNEAADRILEIGCGTGLLTAHLCRLFPHARIDALDMAGGMVTQCRARLAGTAGLFCHLADLNKFRAEALYPLIVSSSTLHWMDPIAEVMETLAGMLTSQGRLVFALMVRGTLAELQSARQRAAPHKPPERRLPTMQAVQAALVQAGLCIEEEREESRRQAYASAGDLLHRLHEQGLTGGPLARSGRLLNRADLRRLVLDYETHYRAGDGVYASYQVAYFRARKA